ncbi:GLPGLI family protein [Elizabethkingia meningoseptica]|uniref:GLPGLI family protein n=1 Tax=Elizabethkingia meningoseptica TaxID=238 RepID=UPI00084218DF|nr:GLPGLI family protein [Elizabethkingia meningoseptica]MDE5481402.1 GLPGLI family protein [Elizabethkingia meningoseptica]MDE5487306.1 GLPGLI family protein [Elizabethkingia meningoseptica]MDE5515153.1 GLPGLI family protein [Elizabethkingia meningoseptica]MDE5525889.1 GLPGLI family protein [Elizabethkingia meningoseptica]MDE5529419.1 GLPGLI family protein [Elizabethkingia meningoseptica]
MNKFFFFFLSFFLYNLSYSQKQLSIKYLNVRSEIANVYETLYTDGVNVISIQDGNIMSTNPNYKLKGRDLFFISKINKGKSTSNNFQYTAAIGYNSDKQYFVSDSVPNFKWTINENSTKKILGYNCIKATTVFRGAKITAYYTPSIPYSVGPFKFFGLPGAILDVREDNKKYDIWKAMEVNLDDKTKVNYHPKFPDYKNVDIKTYIELKDADRKRFSTSVNKTLPAGVHGDSVPERLGLEKIFEWEK